MMMKSTRDSPILVTGAAGAIGAIGRNLTAMLLAKGHKVRALVRREDERAAALRIWRLRSTPLRWRAITASKPS
jgi:nucleoside-diphosphate-sugar epimerase